MFKFVCYVKSFTSFFKGFTDNIFLLPLIVNSAVSLRLMKKQKKQKNMLPV